MEGLDFGGVWLYALCGEYSTVEGNLKLPDVTLQAVKDNDMLFGCLHQLEDVSVMLLSGTAIHTYIIMDHNNAGRWIVVWSICISKMSWNIFRLNGICRNLYLS